MAWLLVLAVVAAMAWVRLAPADPADWHVDPATAAAADGVVRAGIGDARVALMVAGTPAEALARLDAVARETPRTQVLAGSPADGRMTWVTRSLVWGFPDYTTAGVQAAGDGTRIDLFARQRFGKADMGVNAGRLTDWLARLGG